MLTTDATGKYIIASQTLTPGVAITVSRTPISLASSASALVGSSTEVLLGASTTGLAGLIMSAFGDPTGTTTSVVGGKCTGPVFTRGTINNLQASLGAVVGVLGFILAL